jgi:hypothetical protein
MKKRNDYWYYLPPIFVVFIGGYFGMDFLQQIFMAILVPLILYCLKIALKKQAGALFITQKTKNNCFEVTFVFWNNMLTRKIFFTDFYDMGLKLSIGNDIQIGSALLQNPNSNESVIIDIKEKNILLFEIDNLMPYSVFIAKIILYPSSGKILLPVGLFKELKGEPKFKLIYDRSKINIRNHKTVKKNYLNILSTCIIIISFLVLITFFLIAYSTTFSKFLINVMGLSSCVLTSFLIIFLQNPEIPKFVRKYLSN